MQTKTTILFAQRGLPGLLLIITGLALCSVFRHSSAWGPAAKPLLYPLALVLAVGGGSLVSSYVQQRPFRTLKNELLASALIVGTLLLSN